MTAWKYVLAGFVTLSMLSSTAWAQQDQRRQRGMPDSVRQEVEEMLKAGATRQQAHAAPRAQGDGATAGANQRGHPARRGQR